MTLLRMIWALLVARFFNFYTLRAAAVLIVATIAPVLPPEVANAVRSVLDAAGAGDRTKLMLALFGAAYVLADIIRKRRQATIVIAPGRRSTDRVAPQVGVK